MRIQLFDSDGNVMREVVVPGSFNLDDQLRKHAWGRAQWVALSHWFFADMKAPYVSRFLRKAHLRTIWRQRPRDRWRARMRAARRTWPL